MNAFRSAGFTALAACLGALPAAAMSGKKKRAVEKKTAKAENKSAREARLAALTRTLLSVPPPPEKAPKRGATYVSGLEFQDGIHPFFKTYPIDKVGNFTFFCIEGEEEGGVEPRSLVTRSSDGAIAWLTAKGKDVHLLSPSEGYTIVPWPKEAAAPEALMADDHGQIWFAGKGFRGRIREGKTLQDPVPDNAKFVLGVLEAPGTLGFVQKIGDGTPLFQFSGGFIHYDDEGLPNGMVLLPEPGTVHTATWDETRKAVYAIGPEMGALHRASFLSSTCPPPAVWPLEPSGCRIHRITADRAGMIWCTVPDQNALTVFNPDTQTWRKIDLGDELNRDALRPMGIDLGHDGNVWIALNNASAVLRVTPGEKLKFKLFPLLPGQAPTEIVRSGSGRMLVTLPGIGFGALVAVASTPQAPETQEASASSVPGSSSSSSSSSSTPSKPTLSDRQRRELAHQRMLEACERQLRAAAVPGYYDEMLGQSTGPALATAPDRPEEGKEEAPKPKAPSLSPDASQSYLLGRDMFLTPVAIDHIHERHGERHSDPSASRFEAPYETCGGIQSLIAEGLGPVKDIEENLRMDRRGRLYLLCTMPHAIGWWNGKATRKFLVGASRAFDGIAMAFRYEVITAYPVDPRTR